MTLRVPGLFFLAFVTACANPSSSPDDGAGDDTRGGDSSAGGSNTGSGGDAASGAGGASSGGGTGGSGGGTWLDPDEIDPGPAPVRTVCSASVPDCSDPRCHLVGSCEYRTELTCDDGEDNDDDGAPDCGDVDCAGFGSCEHGSELSCADEADNDGDLLSDCDDPDCTASPYCASVEVEISCRDGADNDSDSYADCRDVNCDGQSRCEFAVEDTCDDARDNDGDGVRDCFDADCVGSAVCEVVSETDCSDGVDNDANGATDCADPECSGGACQPSGETACADGIDNDADGLTDCSDASCAATCQPSGETSCADGKDNDGDGATDCLDLGCDGDEGCQYGAETSCGDAKDNDADGLLDCADPDCAGLGSCPGEPGGDCAVPTSAGCEPSGEVTCDDGIDNDGDRRADCLDPDCALEEGASFRCEPAGETSCGDGSDNDLDGLRDCLDPDCAGLLGPEGTACQVGRETTCGDAKDSDLDGWVDCDDADCSGKMGPTFVCNHRFETTCGDGYDNDGDGRTDCLDLDCVDSDQKGTSGCPMDATGTDCRCEYEAETDCDDGFDNDASGLADCDDSDCDASPACTGSGGSGGGSGGSGGGTPVDFCDGGPLFVNDGTTDRCTGDVAATAFRFALCTNELAVSHAITTDSFNSSVGPYGGANIGDDGSVAINQSSSMGSALTVGGSYWVAGTPHNTTGTNSVAVNSYFYNNYSNVGTMSVAGNAYYAGTVGGTFNVAGTKYSGFNFTGYSQPPCDSSSGLTFDIGAIITGFSTVNDNAQEAADIASLNSTNAATVTLECGKYYVNQLTGNAKNITANGPIALFVNGQLQVTQLNITLAAGATVDLFVRNGFGTSSGATIGVQAEPWRTRVYVASSTVNMQGTTNFYGNLYAPASDYTTGGSGQTFYGALAVKKVNTNGPLTIHYDTEVLTNTCEPPPPPPGQHACNTCRDCANQACYDGADADALRECTTCRTNADCCAPLVCNGAGACVAPGGY